MVSPFLDTNQTGFWFLVAETQSKAVCTIRKTYCPLGKIVWRLRGSRVG